MLYVPFTKITIIFKTSITHFIYKSYSNTMLEWVQNLTKTGNHNILFNLFNATRRMHDSHI
jgi:hypothetical protein